MAWARRGSGNSNGLGKAEPSGTTLRASLEARMLNTRALTSTATEASGGCDACSGSGGMRRTPAATK